MGIFFLSVDFRTICVVNEASLSVFNDQYCVSISRLNIVASIFLVAYTVDIFSVFVVIHHTQPPKILWFRRKVGTDLVKVSTILIHLVANTKDTECSEVAHGVRRKRSGIDRLLVYCSVQDPFWRQTMYCASLETVERGHISRS